MGQNNIHSAYNKRAIVLHTVYCVLLFSFKRETLLWFLHCVN